MSDLSPARKQLAEATSRLRQAEAEVHTLEVATSWEGPASTSVREARERVEAAEADVDRAKAGAVQVLLTTARGEQAETPPLTMRAARMALEEARDDLEAAEVAREALRAKLEPAVSHLRIMQNVARDRALDVVREAMLPRSAEVFQRYAEVMKTSMDVKAGLEWLMSAHAINRPEGIQNIKSSGAAAWDAAITELLCNPAAPLPY